jgi:hypothetical protein
MIYIKTMNRRVRVWQSIDYNHKKLQKTKYFDYKRLILSYFCFRILKQCKLQTLAAALVLAVLADLKNHEVLRRVEKS